MENFGRTLALVLCLVCLVVLWSPSAKADQWDQKTTITFNKPVELPGISLGAGTYVFKMLDYLSDPDMVEVLSQDEQTVYGLFRTIPDYHVNITTHTSIIFEERAAGTPAAIKEWFFPDRHNGHEFVYPKPEALELAKAEQPVQPTAPPPDRSEQSRVVEPSEPAPAPEQTLPAAEEQLPLASPQGPETQQMPQVAETQQPEQESMPNELPKTASPLPLMGLLGILLMAGAFGLRVYSGRIG